MTSARRVASLDEVPAGQPKLVELDGTRIVLARVGSAVYACGDVCAHRGGPLSEGKLKMHISKDFFGGELVEEEEALKLIRESHMISLAGQKSVNIALSNKLGSPQAVREIEGVPFLMIYKF